MEHQLTDKELKKIQRIVEHSSAHRWLKMREAYSFSVGDVLVREIKDWRKTTDHANPVYKVQNISSKSNVPRRYKVIHIDEYGVPYAKPIMARGQLGTDIVCMATVDLGYTRYRVDPSYVEHAILAEEDHQFDPTEAYKNKKKARAEITKANRKLREKIKTYDEAQQFLLSLKKGDRLWVAVKGRDDDSHSNEFIVNTEAFKVVKHTNQYAFSRDISWSEEKELERLGKTEYHKVVLMPVNNSYISSADRFNEMSALNCYIYKTQPRKYDVDT